MEILTRAAGCAVVGSLLALLLRKYTPELSLAAAIVSGSVIIWFSVNLCAQIVDVLREISLSSGVEEVYIAPVLKCVGIGILSHLSAQTCRDAQQLTIASAVELCAALCALYVSLPLIRSMLSLLERLL